MPEIISVLQWLVKVFECDGISRVLATNEKFSFFAISVMSVLQWRPLV